MSSRDRSGSWAFADPPNLAVVTVDQILERSLPILHVCHDAEDGGWQFLTGQLFDMAHAKLVSLETIVRLDPSIEQLADLPLGHEATRDAIGGPWRRAPGD